MLRWGGVVLGRFRRFALSTKESVHESVGNFAARGKYVDTTHSTVPQVGRVLRLILS